VNDHLGEVVRASITVDLRDLSTTAMEGVGELRRMSDGQAPLSSEHGDELAGLYVVGEVGLFLSDFRHRDFQEARVGTGLWISLDENTELTINRDLRPFPQDGEA